jgi:hypothetical protein
MSESKVWRVSAADLRRLARATPEAERERKMLVLAEQLEEIERAQSGGENDAPADSRDEDGRGIEPTERTR